MPFAPNAYDFIDPLDLPPISSAELVGGTADGVVPEDGAPRRMEREPPEFHDDPDGARLFAGFAKLSFVTPPAFLTSTRDGQLAGYRMTLTADGRCFHDEALGDTAPAYLDKLASTDSFLNEQTGLRRAERTRFRLEVGGRSRERLSGTVVVLCAGEPYNFGSFMFRVLPKLHAVRRLELSHLPLLVYANAASELEYLALAGVPEGAVRLHDPAKLYSIEHAIRPAMRNAHAFVDAESLALFAGLRQRFGGSGATRLYVSRLGHSRRGGSSRVMINEAALIERLTGLGFLIVEPETLTARQQIELFSSATLVVGPSGAGMFNTVFCRPGTRVIDIESEPHWIHAHSCLFASAGLRYAIVEGRTDPDDARPVHRRWSVNIEALCDRIAGFGAEAAPRPAPPALPRPFEGSLDRVTRDFAAGWAHDRSRPGPVEVEILIDGAPVGRILADQPRPDLQEHGACAFRFSFAPGGAPHASGVVGARVAGTTHALMGSPRAAE